MAPPPAAPPPIDYGYQNDPQLVQARAAAEAGLGSAKAQALEARRKLMIQFGSPEIAKRILGADDPTVAAISGDPANSASVLGRMTQAYNQNVQQTDADLNSGGLFFSGHRGKLLTGLANQRQQQEVDAQRSLEDQLSGISSGLSGAEGAYRDALLAGDQGAYERAQAQALDYGLGPSAPEAPGAPPPGPPGAPPPGHQQGKAKPVGGHVQKLLHDLARRSMQQPKPRAPAHGPNRKKR